MKLENAEQQVSIEETNTSFETIYEKAWFPTEVEDEVKKANLLIIPTNYDSNDTNVFFPETTSDFLEYLHDNCHESITCDIAISDDNYKKLEKHSAVIEIATVIVTSGLWPIAINMISAYLYDLVARYRRTPDNTSAKVRILAEENKNKKTVKIKYDGPVSGVKSMEKIVGEVFSNEESNR